MTSNQRRTTLAICIAVGLTFLISAGLTFLIEPMSEDLGLDSGAIEFVLAIPSIASLVIIFVAGRTGDRLGHRPTLLLLSGAFVLGGVLVATAQEMVSLSAGLALCGASATGIQIVSVSLLQVAVPAGEAHTSAFTTFGMVYPLAYLTFPVFTAGIVDIAAWRLIPIIWAISGGVIAASVWVLVRRPHARQAIGEWLTPLLAGVALATVVRLLDSIGRQGPLAPVTLIAAVLAAFAFLAFALRFKLASSRTFSFAPIRGSVIRVLLLGVAFVALVGTLTYVILALEYMYGMSPLQAALAVIPAQAGAVVGAKLLAGRAMRRWGMSAAGRRTALFLAVAMLPMAAMQATTPAWYLMVCAALFNTAALATVTVLNTHAMSLAPHDSAGAVSAFRGAASSIGSGLGVVVLGTSVITAVNMDTGSADVTAAQVAAVASGLRFDGIVGCVIALVAWLALTLGERRRTQSPRSHTA